MNWLASVLSSSICVAAPVAYGSIGEIFTERSGISNLGLEGVMLVGAIFGYKAAVDTGSLLLAVLATLLAGAVLGLFYAFITVTLQANQIVSGLAMVILGTGLSGTIGKKYTGVMTGVSFQKIALPGLSKIPFLGTALFTHDILIYALFLLVPLACIYIYKTRPGLRLRALGENPGALDAAGLNVTLMRYLYVMFGSAVTSMGGMYITLAYTPFWNDGITTGNGWISAALVIFASWNPAYAALGALLFGFVQVLGLRLQLMNVSVSSYFLSMLPYLCTIFVLIFSTGSFSKRRAAAPGMLGQRYDREAR